MVATVSATACGTADETLGTTAEPLMLIGARWPTVARGSGQGADIEVCYRTRNIPVPSSLAPGALDAEPDSDDYRARMAYFKAAAVVPNRTWGRITDINFTGFGECGSNTAGLLAINLVRGGTAHSQLGYQGASRATNVYLNIFDSRIELVTAHELGHALGFAHEFSRPDWTEAKRNMACATDADCRDPDYGNRCLAVTLDSGEQGHFCRFDGTVLTPVDRDSVLACSYIADATTCQNPKGVSDPIHTLTTWDVLGAQSVYGTKPGGSLVGSQNLCAKVSANDNAADIAFAPCSGSANDTFVPVPTSSGDRLFEATLTTGAKRCINLKGGSTAPNTPAIAYTCTPFYANHNERIQLEHMQLRAMGNRCVAATAAARGATLELRNCLNADPSLARWDVVSDTLRLAGTQLCATYSTTQRGTKPTLQPCAEDGNMQTFRFEANEIRISNRCFNVRSSSISDGNPIVLWDYCGTGQVNEAFYLTGELHTMGTCLSSQSSTNVTANACQTADDLTPALDQEWDYYWR